MKNQKKVFARLSALLLIFASVLACFASCGSDDEGGNGNKGNGVNVDKRLEGFEELNLPESEIIISLSKFTSTEIPNESWQYVQGPERTGSDSVLNLVYERNQNVQAATHVYPSYVYTNLNYAGIAEDVRKHVMMPSAETPDLYIDQIYGMVRAQMEGNLMNVLSDETNYFDFGTDKTANYQGWYNSYMNGFNFASDEKMYMLAGDYFMDVIRMLNLTAVNLSNFEEYFYKGDSKKPELGTGKDYLYNTVEAGNWTIDQMVEWSNTAYKDTNNNSKKDKTDRLGVLVYDGGCSAMSILPSNDVSLYKVSEDGKTFKVEQNKKAVNSINAWQAVFASKGAHVLKTTEAANGYADLATTFIDGDVLFAPGIQLFQLETQEMKSMEDQKCLIPYPKLTASDPYYVFTHDNARVGGILKTTQNFEAISAYLQAASMTSDTILDEYYNVALKYKNGTDYGSTKMLDIVYDHICNPKWINDSAILSVTNNTFSNNNQHPTYYTRVTQDKTNTYASAYTAAQSRLTSALNSYKALFDALN